MISSRFIGLNFMKTSRSVRLLKQVSKYIKL
jgi:hypothetical protein